jgi:uncharacterized protein (DUF2252 family)
MPVKKSRPARASRSVKGRSARTKEPEPGIYRGEILARDRRAAGKALRDRVPREVHAEWSRRANFPGAVEIVMETNKGRQPNLIPLRLARMACSPFAFYRGAAAVMAHDLAGTPVTNIKAVIDGDAHLNNFGLYGTPQRDVVFDLNDFDETVLGPWEWDLKRLTASVNLAARENGISRRERDAAVRRCVRGYRFNLNRLQSMGILETWYLHAYPGRENPIVQMDPKSKAVIQKSVAKAATQTNLALLNKVAEKQRNNGGWRFIENAPVLTRVDTKTRVAVAAAIENYAKTLPRERQFMLTRYRVADVAHRVVGVGSVGTRAYLALMFGNGDQDPLFLQVKEAIVPALAPFIKRDPEFSHEGKRVVIGQRALQSSTDVMLGWTEIDSRPYYVRQMKNMKGSIPIEWLTGSAFSFYGWACGAILARAHARTTDPALLAGYCGKSSVLDDALALWAEAYANQTVLDHAALVKAVKDNRQVQALMGK